jgi:hypothetical protein
MPISIDCGLVEGQPERDCEGCPDSAYFTEFALGTIVFGRLYPNRPHVTILTGQVAEFSEASLQTYTLHGLKIDSLYIGGGCGGDNREWSRTHCSISDDGTLEFADTTMKWILGTQADSEPDSIYVKKMRFVLEQSGKFRSLQSSLDMIRPEH